MGVGASTLEEGQGQVQSSGSAKGYSAEKGTGSKQIQFGSVEFKQQETKEEEQVKFMREKKQIVPEDKGQTSNTEQTKLEGENEDKLDGSILWISSTWSRLLLY